MPTTRSEKPTLYLFVWTGFCPDYTDGLAFAIAPDETEARRLVEKQRGTGVYGWGALTMHPLTTTIAFSVSGGG